MDTKELNLKVEQSYENFKERLEHSKEVYEVFLNLYPFHEHPEKIDLLKPDDIYNPGNKSFLYYIEHGLGDCGRIKVGNAQYAINARKQIETFKKLLHIAVDDSISVANKVDAPWEKIKFFGRDKHLAKKIIFCYNTRKVLPVYKTEHLEHFASLIDPEFKFKENNFQKEYEDLSIGEKFEYLNNIILKFKNEAIKTEMDNNSFMWVLYDYSHPDNNKWFFTVNMELNPDFKEKSKIKWNSAKEVKKGDILLFYSGKPNSHIGEIFRAETNPYEDQSTKEKWNMPAIDVLKITDIKNPIKWTELQENNILKNSAAVKMHFGKSHFKISTDEWNELKKLILIKNPDLKGILNHDTSLEPIVDIITPLEIIFKKLSLAKKRKEKVKSHEVGKAFSDIKNTILEIANSIHPEINYHAVAYTHARGNWYPRPYVYIEDFSK